MHCVRKDPAASPGSEWLLWGCEGWGRGDSAITLGAGWGAQAGECRDPRELAIRLYLSFNVK